MQNKTFGSTLIVAGVTIGAGMLAMPLTSAEMGFGYTLILLVSLWVLLSFSALLFVEAYQKAPKADAGIATLSEQYFGITGRLLATASLVVFMYAIIAAYISGGGDLLSGILPFTSPYNPQIAIVIFTVVFGLMVTVGTQTVDMATRILFIIKLIAFACVLFMLLPKVTMDNLSAVPLHKSLLISASPVFFTSFGFHVVIPSIHQYLEGNVKKLRISIVAGTGIPLVAYILWQMAIHGTLTQVALSADPTLNGLVKAITQITHSRFIGEILRLFSTLALVTSFLGVALSLLHCLDDLLKRINIHTNKIVLSLLTFVPPLVFSLFYPAAFIMALGYAGQMFAFFGLLLPIAIVWRMRSQFPDVPYRVLGGRFSLIVAFLLGVLIMNVPFLIQSGYLPQVAG